MLRPHALVVPSLALLALASLASLAEGAHSAADRRQRAGAPEASVEPHALGLVVVDAVGHLLRAAPAGAPASLAAGERLAWAWTLEGDPFVLQSLPGEMRVLDAPNDDARHATVYAPVPAGKTRVSLGPAAPPWLAAAVPPFGARTAGPRAPGGPVGSVRPSGGTCLDPCLLYSGDGSGRLFSIDPDAGTSTFIANMGDVMFDVAVTTDGRLLGLSGGGILYDIDPCDGSLFALGTPTFGNGLCGDPLTNDVFVQGPPLQRIDMPGLGVTTIGGTFGADPPFWCGGSSGDLSADPADGFLYSSLGCPECSGGDRLVSIDPFSGDAVAEVGCFFNPGTGMRLSGVFGLAHDCECRLFAATSGEAAIYLVDPTTAICTRIPISGGFAGTYGMGAMPPVACGNAPPTCDPTADAPSCGGTTLHANASDPDGDPLTYSWRSADCPDAVFTPGSDVPDPDVHVEPACRTCTFELAVDDGNGGTCTGSVGVVFADTRGPDLSPAALVSCLWSPNHQFVDVGLSAGASDDCGGDVTIVIGSITSDEATGTELGAGGAHRHCPDAIVDGMRVLLRAERSGLGDGRVYRIGITATDACGNTTTSVAEVRVPHDQDPKTPGQTNGNDPDGPCPAVESGTPHDATGCD